ncbi:hypothetical protein RHSIM_Rhsim04G0074600 [Rhododendron simsii]|uniref:Uncharacterized protein n=1 Tax=Rhododendron simsii TaxID=118357 RepID=A0A834H590_RHOSS|nr:hypothetical protein RHSIM_Rhsim04G0074600 [Rhododendron simsii]
MLPGYKHDFMLLKNLMEEKQLNFNRPLLSLRRFPSTVSTETDEKKRTGKSLPNVRRIPCYRPELKSGPVRIPGTVPFVWEQYPGRPKAKAESHTQTRSPIIPKPPPGRVLKAKPTVPRNVYEKQVISSVGENAVEEKECFDSGDGSKAHVDARNTLQPTGVATNKKRSIMCATLKMEPYEFRDTVIDNSIQGRYRSNSQNLVGSSLYMRLQGRGVPLPKNEFPQSRFFEEEIFLHGSYGFTSPKRSNSFRVAEKTAYVDFLHKVVSLKSNSFSSDGTGLPNSINCDSEIIARVTNEELILPSKRLNHADPSELSSSCKSDQEAGRELLKGLGQDQYISDVDCFCESRTAQQRIRGF